MPGDYITPEDLRKATHAIVAAYRARPSNCPRLVVGLAGRPGSGKTTVLSILSESVQRALPVEDHGTVVACMPMDGYHLYKRELQAMANSEEAFRRRGSEWTFNPRKLAADLQAIRTPSSSGTYADVWVPQFFHGVGDPEEHAICIPSTAHIVMVEGNYLLYRGTPEWAAVYGCFDLTLFLQCSRAECIDRIYRRHMAVWKVSQEEAMLRATGNDAVNGDLVDSTVNNADIVIHSRTNAVKRNSKL